MSLTDLVDSDVLLVLLDNCSCARDLTSNSRFGKVRAFLEHIRNESITKQIHVIVHIEQHHFTITHAGEIHTNTLLCTTHILNKPIAFFAEGRTIGYSVFLTMVRPLVDMLEVRCKRLEELDRLRQVNITPFDLLVGIVGLITKEVKLLLEEDDSTNGLQKRRLLCHNVIQHCWQFICNLLELVGQSGFGFIGVFESITRWCEIQLSHSELHNQTITHHLVITKTLALVVEVTDLVGVHRIANSSHDSEALTIVVACITIEEHPILRFVDRSIFTPIHICTRDSRFDIKETKRFCCCTNKLVEISLLDRNLHTQSIGFSCIIGGYKCDSRITILFDERIVDALHTLMDGSDSEVVRIAERTLTTKTQATNLIVGIGLGRSKIDSVDVVDVVVRDTCPEILDSQPRFQGIRKMHMERLIRFTRHDHSISGITSQLTNNGERFVRIQVRENLKCLL